MKSIKRTLCFMLSVLHLLPTSMLGFGGHVSLPRTSVYLVNAIESGQPGHQLPIKFGHVVSTGQPLSVDRYWPKAGVSMMALGPTRERPSGVTQIAELSRYFGIKADTDYFFTQTVDLPGLGPVLEFKQRVRGEKRNTDAWVGIAAPTLGIPEQWFFDEEWHQFALPYMVNGQLVGYFTITFGFYHKPSALTTAFNDVARYTNADWIVHGLTSAGSALAGLGMGDLRAANLMRKMYEESELVRGRSKATVQEFPPIVQQTQPVTYGPELLSGQQGPPPGYSEQQFQQGQATEEGGGFKTKFGGIEWGEGEPFQPSFEESPTGKTAAASSGVGGTVGIVGGVLFTAASLYALSQGWVPSLYANILYKIEYQPITDGIASGKPLAQPPAQAAPVGAAAPALPAQMSVNAPAQTSPLKIPVPISDRENMLKITPTVPTAAQIQAQTPPGPSVTIPVPTTATAPAQPSVQPAVKPESQRPMQAPEKVQASEKLVEQTTAFPKIPEKAPVQQSQGQATVPPAPIPAPPASKPQMPVDIPVPTTVAPAQISAGQSTIKEPVEGPAKIKEEVPVQAPVNAPAQAPEQVVPKKPNVSESKNIAPEPPQKAPTEQNAQPPRRRGDV